MLLHLASLTHFVARAACEAQMESAIAAKKIIEEQLRTAQLAAEEQLQNILAAKISLESQVRQLQMDMSEKKHKRAQSDVCNYFINVVTCY